MGRRGRGSFAFEVPSPAPALPREFPSLKLLESRKITIPSRTRSFRKAKNLPYDFRIKHIEIEVDGLRTEERGAKEATRPPAAHSPAGTSSAYLTRSQEISGGDVVLGGFESKRGGRSPRARFLREEESHPHQKVKKRF